MPNVCKEGDEHVKRGNIFMKWGGGRLPCMWMVTYVLFQYNKFNSNLRFYSFIMFISTVTNGTNNTELENDVYQELLVCVSAWARRGAAFKDDIFGGFCTASWEWRAVLC